MTPRSRRAHALRASAHCETGALKDLLERRVFRGNCFVRSAVSASNQIAVDGRMLAAPVVTGVGVYADMLARAAPAAGFTCGVLQASGQVSRPARWLRATRRGARRARRVASGASARPEWAAADLFREAQVFFNLYGELMPVVCDDPPPVMHWTYPVPLYVVGARNIYTVHDLIPLAAPHLTRIRRQRHRRLLSRIVERADRIVTVSETVRHDVIGTLGLPAERVVNTYQAVDAPSHDAPPSAPLQPQGYFLFCGAVEPRKNLERLADAHALSGVSQPLIVVGPAAPGCEALEARLRGRLRLIRTGSLPRREVVGLIRNSLALLHPSLAEGFGLPIAEAMTLGAPVLTSARGACAEIAGPAARLVDPEDVKAIARGIADLAADGGLRQGLRNAGQARAGMFGLDAYARRLARLYADVLGDPPAEAAA
jgi:glycosyltransferase involved in cell wall biosynthesis